MSSSWAFACSLFLVLNVFSCLLWVCLGSIRDSEWIRATKASVPNVLIVRNICCVKSNLLTRDKQRLLVLFIDVMTVHVRFVRRFPTVKHNYVSRKNVRFGESCQLSSFFRVAFHLVCEFPHNAEETSPSFVVSSNFYILHPDRILSTQGWGAHVFVRVRSLSESFVNGLANVFQIWVARTATLCLLHCKHRSPWHRQHYHSQGSYQSS